MIRPEYKKKINDLFFRIRYFRENYLQILHLAFSTKKFGINNRLYSRDHSLFGRGVFQGFFGLFSSIRMMKARAFMGFIPLKDAVRLFPAYAREHLYSDDKKER